MFTPVCHSVHMGEGGLPNPRMQTTPDAAPLGVGQTVTGCRPTWGWADPPYGQQAGGTHPTGMHTCFLLSLIAYILMENFQIDYLEIDDINLKKRKKISLTLQTFKSKCFQNGNKILK